MKGYWKDRGVAYLLSDLSQSVFSTLGLPGTDNVLDIPPNDARRECILLVDGMGKNALELVSKTLPIFSQLKTHQQLSATFPSTTSSSLTSFGTGSHVGSHGMVGYTMRVPHSGTPERLLNALKWDERVDPFFWQPKETLFEIGAKNGINVSHVAAKRYEDTGFTRAVFRGATYRGANLYPDLVSECITALSQTPAFVYLYVNDLDVAGHVAGYGSDKWLETLKMIDNLVGKIRERLPKGTRLWITGDHGMLNAGEKIVIGRDNLLLTEVSEIAGEPRARHIYLARPEISKEIAELWRSELSGKANIYTREEAINQNLFGQPVSRNFAERIGDVIAIAKSDEILIDPAREKLESAMVGHHGGLTDIESSVPLLQITI